VSQAGIISTTAGPVPPAVPTSFQTDVNSPSVPIANLEKVFGGSSTVNNNNGIQTDGSSGSNTLTVQLTNRASATVTTLNATPTTLITFPLGATPGVFVFTIDVAAFDSTDVAGAGFTFWGTVRTTGAAATLCGTPDKVDNIEGSIAATTIDSNLIVSANNAIVQVTGIAAKTIDWRAVLTYVFVS